jgi:hypothetical protein
MGMESAHSDGAVTDSSTAAAAVTATSLMTEGELNLDDDLAEPSLDEDARTESEGREEEEV